MKMHLAAALCCALAAPVLAQDNPFAGMKGKVKEGQWDYVMQMGTMPGMPAGMKMPEMKFSHCLTAKDIEQGSVGQQGGKMPEGCKVSNMKMAGNNASYTMECTKEPKMKADVQMTFVGDGFTMKQDMTMDMGGQPVRMTNNMTGKYMGACKK